MSYIEVTPDEIFIVCLVTLFIGCVIGLLVYHVFFTWSDGPEDWDISELDPPPPPRTDIQLPSPGPHRRV